MCSCVWRKFHKYTLKGYLLIIKQASSVCVKTEVSLGCIGSYIACEPDSYWAFPIYGLYILYIYIYIYIYIKLSTTYLYTFGIW